MNFSVCTLDPAKHNLDCLVIGIFDDENLQFNAAHIDSLSHSYIQDCLNSGDFIPRVGNTHLLSCTIKDQPNRLLLVGCGKVDAFNETQFDKILTSAFLRLQQTNCKNIGLFLNELLLPGRSNAWLTQQCILKFQETYYNFDVFKTAKNPSFSLDTLIFHASSAQEIAETEVAIREAKAMAQGIKTTKDLANSPCNVCTPEFLAEKAQALTKQYPSLAVRIFDEKTLAKMGFGAFCAVAQGSSQPGKLIVFEYNGDKKDTPPFALIGKGITFDTGGISLKSPTNMIEMKYDMTGAATVFGVMETIAELDLSINLVVALACAENMPDGNAIKPESVVTSFSGKTIEITNTDAEGRLVLCDTLSYIEKEYKPQAMIDIATLTGAVVVALGREMAGYFANDNPLAKEIELAAQQSHDKIWRLPLDDAYQTLLESQCADMMNASLVREAGSCVAASFLSQFIENTPWIHLDIAGVAYISGSKKAATGHSVALLSQYLINQCLKQIQSTE